MKHLFLVMFIFFYITTLKAQNFDAGQLDGLQKLVCSGESITITAFNYNTNNQGVLGYALKNPLTNQIEVINNTGTFSQLNLQTNFTYYAYSVVGLPLNNDPTIPDINQAGTVFSSNYNEVVFLTPIIVADSVVCEGGGSGLVTIRVNGGYPAFDNTASYAMSGNVGNILLGINEEFAFSVDEGTAYNIYADDDAGCQGEAYGINNCIKCPYHAGNIGASKTVCDGNELFAIHIGANLGDDGVLSYYINNAITNEFVKNVSQLNISKPQDLNTNTPYKIFAVVGKPDPNDPSKPDLTAQCVSYSDTSEFVFLDPIIIQDSIVCDQNEFTVYNKINGGKPAYDPSLKYQVTGSNTLIVAPNQWFWLTTLPQGSSFGLIALDDASCEQNFTMHDFSCALAANTPTPNAINFKAAINNNQLNLSYTATQNNHNISLKLFNVIGKVLKQFELTTKNGLNTWQLPVLNLNSGVYLVQLLDGNKSLTQKIVK